eukprot:scaffold7661_cov92-Amphora_coffeaeformis.AAC.1
MRSPSNSTVRFKWSTTARPTATKYEVEDVPGLEDLQIADETDAKKCLLCERNAFISLPTTTTGTPSQSLHLDVNNDHLG